MEKYNYISSKNNILEILFLKYGNFLNKHYLLNNLNTSINLFEQIFQESHDKEIIWYLCSMTVNIDILKKFSEKPWNWYIASRSLKISISDIENNLDLGWNWAGVSRNPNLNINFIKKYKNNLDWYWISKNSCVKADDIKNNPSLPWDIDSICENPNIDISILETMLDVDRLSDENWKELSINMKISLDIFEKYINKWNYKFLSRNEKLNISIIEKYPDKCWDFAELSSHPGIKIQHVISLNKPWNWFDLSKNPNICIEIVKKYPSLPWKYNALSRNPSITIEDIENNDKLPWNYKYVSLNPNLTIDFIEKNLYEIDWKLLVTNEFLYDDFVYKKNIKIDIEKRKRVVNNEINHLFYKDICGEILNYVGYN